MPELIPPAPDPAWRAQLAVLMARARQAPAVLATAAVGGLLVLVVALWLRGSSPPRPAEIDLPMAGSGAVPAATTVTTAPADVVVHVAGAVARPGVHRLPAGSRVADAVAAAGGALPGADPDRLNLAAPVSDGERVYVLRAGEEQPPAPAAGGAGAGGSSGRAGPLDLNSATLEQLEALPGVGPAIAQAIVDYRQTHGRFRSVDELLEVRGIGDAKLAQLRDQVRV